MGSQTHSYFPVIDFTEGTLKPGSGSWVSACQVIRSAFEEHGCFVALYDKIPPELYNSVFSAVAELLDLPPEIKTQKTSDKPFHSYHGERSNIPLYESLGIENPLNIEGLKKFTSMMWPQGNDHFWQTLNSYAKALSELDYTVKEMVFDAYGLKKREGDPMLESDEYMLRCFKYRVAEENETNPGLRAHTDTSFFTILHQNSVNGLQVKVKGEWIDVDFSPNKFMVLAADALTAWSNDRIRPCDHRVIMTANKVRYSTGLFSFGANTVRVNEELVDKEHPPLYKPFDHFSYLRFCITEAAMKADSRIKEYCGV